LGYLLIVGANSLNTARVFSVLIALTVMGIVLFAAMSAIEDLAIPWHVSKRRQLPSAGQ
jgi:NitT/TauT family transport system permease protein